MLQLYVWLNSFLNSRRNDEQGATLVEYGMMVALIAAVCVGIVGILGGKVQAAFTLVSNAL